MVSEPAQLLSTALSRNARELPDRSAAIDGEWTATWAELDTMVSSVAGSLRQIGVRSGDLVALHLKNGLDQLVAVHATLRLGAAFVPIDPASPESRIASILEQCDAVAMFTDPATAARFDSELGLGCVVVDTAKPRSEAAGHAQLALCPSGERVREPEPIDDGELAYVMFTSGSTGPPKGMRHTHRSSLGFAGWGQEFADLVHDDIVANFSPLHFDISVFDLFSSLLAGATVLFVPQRAQAFPAQVAALLEQHRVSIAFTVPFALARLARHGGLDQRNMNALRWVLFGGEPFQPQELQALMELLPSARFANVFGPAEAPACVTYEVRLPLDIEQSIPIGTPAPNTVVAVVDSATLNPVPVGEIGELLVSAPSITVGYHGRSDLDARTQVRIGQRDYFRTGDLVRREPTGEYSFHGRNDRMVKTRGFRVELDEVEAALAAHPGIVEAAAYAVNDGATAMVMAAVIADATDPDDVSLRSHLTQRLPAYALPVDIVRMTQFPRTTSDKINRSALAADHQERHSR